jgi:hypothetical protein
MQAGDEAVVEFAPGLCSLEDVTETCPRHFAPDVDHPSRRRMSVADSSYAPAHRTPRAVKRALTNEVSV